MDILNSPDEGFLSMEDSSHQVAPMRITGPECNISGNVTQESENYILGVCGECIRPIMDQYYLAVDGQTWHLSCLRCAICNCDLQWQSSCFSYRGRLVWFQNARANFRRRSSNKGGENVEATMSQNSSISGGTPVGDFESPNDY
ncbi:unnamed protein product [Hymenolepis diminuta]|uniref:LIM zinc-binding domain-containing protein n=1 Tax=Hymenolepis diminuta TaxID=6216 RepID=A0A158QEA1_HYMDI|nr:unnamed protein product [Hymenolepis diminuta]